MSIKKETLLMCIVVAIVAITAIVLYVFMGRAKQSQNATLSINGVLLTNDKVKLYPDHAEIPLIEALACYGFSVRWESDETALLTCENKTVLLSLSSKKLINLDTGDNLLIMAPGSQFFCCEVSERDIVIDMVTFQNALRFLECDVAWSFDHDRAIIYLTINP